MQLSDFNYRLPDELIAQFPHKKRRGSRLLGLLQGESQPQDLMFSDLPSLLQPGDLLVLNNTQVMRARLYGNKPSGGKVEVLIERVIEPGLALAHIRASKSPKPGTWIELGDSDQCVEVTGREGDLFLLRSQVHDFYHLMNHFGHMPLPPYIARDDKSIDMERYQTVYAQSPGAVAAPTAGLHFDQEMLNELSELGVNQATVTLHVGAGTFQPVRVKNLDEHIMHKEYVEVDEAVCQQVVDTRKRGGRVVAVGTTCVRSLEAASSDGAIKPYQGDTRLFIKPGYRFRSVDAMITNFHLPQSTLLMLVAAFAGYDRIMNAYQHAIEKRYRFFSYGDAMFLTPAEESNG
ncbi:tRNA preQ1(34) S-adenosylmethionine ribosyltransferase-isomerase QueA [Candidatus Thiodiazotropha sp. CDECU1]|uniref:tRNA preQ1(34) S-adenosylmethionine ribosyltransferase-isomerase QueA n=1 Tax=Candidatus Thiodiazotropha sp. CDECU1 TaxID=3065865 RepID=UPI00292E1008|nr:tRNA preQ1(34) S-adenosylmethionine ribosyltransferase-isomerase QueA [Candidatus Thiodiazotropha sp. CDECU1]